MLSSILIFLLAILMPFFCLFSFRAGFKYGSKPEEAASEPVLPKPRKKAKETKEERRNRQILENIENYTGDSTGQKEIK